MPTFRTPTKASRRPNGTATAGELATLACSYGLIDKNEPARQAFMSWLAADPTAAQKALFARVAAKQVAASGRKPTNNYPASWLRASGIRTGSVRITEGRD